MPAGCALTASAKAAGEGSKIFAHLRTGSGDRLRSASSARKPRRADDFCTPLSRSTQILLVWWAPAPCPEARATPRSRRRVPTFTIALFVLSRLRVLDHSCALFFYDMAPAHWPPGVDCRSAYDGERALVKLAGTAGGRETMYAAIAQGDKEFADLIAKMIDNGIQLIYFGGYVTETGLFVRQARSRGLTATMMVTSGSFTKSTGISQALRLRARW